MILTKAAKISKQFCEKSQEAQIYCVKYFVKVQGLVQCLDTHESQKAPEETQTETLDFIEVIRPKLQLQCQNKAFILNMDQTPTLFTFNSKTMFEVVGARTVHVHKSTNDTKCATVAITVTASGKMLLSLLLFNGLVDIGINKPYKKHMRHQWEIWTITEGMLKETTSSHTCEEIVNRAKYANEGEHL